MILINGQMYECEPAVEAYIKDLQAENEEQRREILNCDTDLQQHEDENMQLWYDNNKLKAEIARLEEAYQKATGVIATDSLPTAVDCYKLKKMCIEKQGCRECAFRRENVEGFDRCAFEGLPMDWNFGGANNEQNGI